jgi:hypothetical protein
MALTAEEAIVDLQIINADLVNAVNVTKASIEARIAEAVIVSENATIIPLANSVTNLITTQTLFINLLNK